MTKPDPNNPIWHQNPPDPVPSRVPPPKPGAREPYQVPETEANPEPKKKPKRRS
jgi:hypothetical protein